MARSRPVSKFKSYTHQALADFAQGIHDALNGNATFPTPPVTLAAQQAAITAFENAIVAWGPKGNRGSHSAHVALLDARAVVEENIRNIEDYADGIAAGDKAILLSAGLVPKEDRNPFGVLPAPQNLRSPYSKHTLQAQYRLRWKKVKGAKSYNVYMSSDSIVAHMTFVMSVTKTLAVVEAASLPSGTLQYFWVAAFGTSGESVLSDVCAARNP